MSSSMDGGILIGTAVALPVAAAFGAGWLAWQGGKLAVEGIIAVNEYVDEKKRRAELETAQRMQAAVSGQEHLITLRDRAIAELESEIKSGNADITAKQTLAEMRKIAAGGRNGAVETLENRNLADQMKLEALISRRSRQRSADSSRENAAVSSQLRSMRLAFEAAVISAGTAENITAPNPEVKERAGLVSELYAAAADAASALDEVREITERCGLSKANAAWFRSIFGGVDDDIARLLSPTASTSDIKVGVRRLRDAMEQYRIMRPTIIRDAEKILALYPVYAEASKALCEKVEDIRAFDTPEQLEKRMHELEERKKKSDEKAAIYRKLGPSAYVSLAVDTELQRMGYSVYKKSGVAELAGEAHKPEYAKIGDKPIPFFEWGDDGKTQFYSISDDCSLQLVVNKDGYISMQTIGDEKTESEKIKTAQKSHCSMMKSLRKSLLENWFIEAGYEERVGPDAILYAAEWQTSESNVWTAESSADRRSEEKQELLAMRQK